MDLTPMPDRDASITYPEDYDLSLNGIGGWLVLIIIGRFLSIFFGIKGICDISPYAGYDAQLDVIVYASIIFDIVVTIIMSGIILYFIFKRNILFRILMVIQVGVAILFSIVSMIYMSNFGVRPDIAYFIGTLIECTIWIVYLYRSKRVKNTYIYSKLY